VQAHPGFKSLPLRQYSTFGRIGGPSARIASQVDVPRILAAIGLTVWLGGLVVAVAYIRRRMRFPKSMYQFMYQSDPVRSLGWYTRIPALLAFAVAGYLVPTVAWVAAMFGSGVAIYGVGVYVVALTVERRRAKRLGLPEPGTDGSTSFAESAVFLAIALPFAVAALALIVYGIANELGGNRSEGGAALGLGVAGLFIAIFMGLFGSPLLLIRRRG
jgi:hypothetical protein